MDLTSHESEKENSLYYTRAVYDKDGFENLNTIHSAISPLVRERKSGIEKGEKSDGNDQIPSNRTL